MILEKQQECTLAQRRSYMILVAMLADDVERQKRHPQMLIGNRRLMPMLCCDDLQIFVAHSQTQFVCRRQSPWVDATNLVRMEYFLRQSLHAIWTHIHVIVLMDCCPLHASSKVIAPAKGPVTHL